MLNTIGGLVHKNNLLFDLSKLNLLTKICDSLNFLELGITAPGSMTNLIQNLLKKVFYKSYPIIKFQPHELHP